MHPIEHLRDELKRCIRGRDPASETLGQCNPRGMGEHSSLRGRDSHTINEKCNESSHKSQRRKYKLLNKLFLNFSR